MQYRDIILFCSPPLEVVSKPQIPMLCILSGSLLYNGVQQANILCTSHYNIDRTSS
jgi:hypothetical protein